MSERPGIDQRVKKSLLLDPVDRVHGVRNIKIGRIGVINLFGAETPFIRPEDHAHHTASAESFLKHAVEWLEANEGPVDIVVYLQCTDLFRDPMWIDVLVQKLIDDPSLDSAFVAYPTHKNYWRKTDLGYERITDVHYQPRQIREPLYREDTGLGCATRASIIKQGRRLGDKVSILENHQEASGIDIQNEFDLWLAETVMKKLLELGELNLPYLK